MSLRGSVIAVVTLVALGSTSPAHASPGDELWSANFGVNYYGYLQKVSVASDGRVFATGSAEGTEGNDLDYLTVSLAPDGTKLWTRYYRGPGDDPANDTDLAGDLAFGPTEHRLYVTGSSEASRTAADWATVAYRADGTRLWSARYDGPAGGDDIAASVAVSSRSGRVFVTGSSTGKTSKADITTIAYSSDGERRWTRRYDGRASGADRAARLVVDPSGRRLYVIGTTATSNRGTDILVLAYRADGTPLWRERFRGAGSSDDTSTSAALGPNGRHLYVAGASENDYVTLALRRDGTALWSDHYDGPATGKDVASDIGVSPDGQTLFVSGRSEGDTDDDVATLGYTSAGDRLWVTRYDSGEGDSSGALAVSPDGSQLFVATGHDTMTTIAYDSSGDQLWLQDDPWNGEGAGSHDVAAAPDGASVVVVGAMRDVYWDAVAVAYATT